MNVYLPNLRLPSAYQEVEYIWRNGNNYIDTWWIPKNSIPYEIKWWVRIPTSWQRYVLLSNWDSTSTTGSVSNEINSWNITNNKARYFTRYPDSSNEDFYSSNSVNVGSFNDLIYKNTSSSNSITVNWTVTTWTLLKNTYYNKTAYIFVDRDFRYTTLKNFDLSYCQIYENWTLIRDFVPCYRKSDSVIWLYDLVNNQFYTNAWTGTFSKGNDVTMAELKNAYIGEVYEYSYDFRGKSISTIKNDWWNFILWESSASSTSDWLYWGTTLDKGTILKRETLSTILPTSNKVIMTLLAKTDYANVSTRLYRLATSSQRIDITWTSYQVPSSRDSSSDYIQWHIYGTATNQSITRSNYANKWVTTTCTIDFTNKQMIITDSVWFSKTIALTDTQVNNIKNNSIWHLIWLWAYAYIWSIDILVQ